MKLNKFLIIILAVNSLLAQYKTTAIVKTIKESGLHKIVLPAEIRSYSKEELSDFRILDSKEKEVPYYILQENEELSSSSFSECKIISKTLVQKNKTTIIFENPKTSIEEIILSIINTDVSKSYSISGSNNQKEWFGLVNNSILNGLKNSENTSVLKAIPLPLTSYRYLKIDFNDKKTLPINVLKIGYLTTKTSNPKLEEVFPKSMRISQFASPKKTQIQVSFHNPQIVNQISFHITNPNLYRRNARIFVNKKSTTKQKKAIFQETLSNFELNSDTKNTFNIPQILEKECFIEIENRDNPPLTLAKIKFFQKQIAVIADLKANEKYTIQTGNPKLPTPEYDLENFRNSIDNNLPEAKIYNIKHLDSQKTNLKNQSIWQQAWFMWLCIVLGGIAVAFFTKSLIKDMKKIT